LLTCGTPRYCEADYFQEQIERGIAMGPKSTEYCWKIDLKATLTL